MEFEVPAGTGSGQGLVITTPDGQQITVVVPAGAVAGQTLRIEVPSLQQQQPQRQQQQTAGQQPSSFSQESDDGGSTGYFEKAGVVAVSVVGFFGVVGSMAMLHHLDTPGEGFIFAFICVLVAAALQWKVQKELGAQGESAPGQGLSPAQDTILGAVVLLSHLALGAVFYQGYYSFVDTTVDCRRLVCGESDGGSINYRRAYGHDKSGWDCCLPAGPEARNCSARGAVVAPGVPTSLDGDYSSCNGEGSNYQCCTAPLTTGQISPAWVVAHVVVALAAGGLQARWLATMGARYPGLRAATPNGGYLSWLALAVAPFFYLFFGLGQWSA
jgi:hypothetical protein